MLMRWLFTRRPTGSDRSNRNRAPRPAPRFFAGTMGLSLLAMCGSAPFAHGCGPKGQGTDGAEAASGDADAQQARVEIDLFALGRQLGAVAPCGCTTEPLGGLQYAFGYIESSSSAGQRVILEPGSFLFPDPSGPEAPTDEAAWAQAEQRATLLSARFNELGDSLVSGFGPTDVASPHALAALSKWPMPRALANLSPEGREQVGGVVGHRQVTIGTRMTAGVTAVVDSSIAGATKDFPPVTDPVAAAKAEVEVMRKGGAALTIVMVQGPRTLAEQVARDSGADVVLMGGALEGADRSRLGSAVQKVGNAYLVEPGDQVQTISHLTLSLDPKALENGLPGPGTWALVPPVTQRKQELAQLEERLAKFEADPSAEKAFLDRLRKERDELQKGLESNELPDAPAVAVFEQVKVTCHLAVDAAAKKALGDYDGWVATENAKRFAGVKAPAPAKGEAGYVGIEECEMCHDEAASYWKTTVHARAYDTLVQANKQFDLSCVGCHVTGFRKPGGSEVVENEGLTSVQCEQCHGPGSLHIEDPEGTRLPAQTPVTVCGECHTPEHSDTFDYDAYLRDVLGAGHGADARAKLGDGPTGKQLREAGLAKAGGACKKM